MVIIFEIESNFDLKETVIRYTFHFILILIEFFYRKVDKINISFTI